MSEPISTPQAIAASDPTMLAAKRDYAAVSDAGDVDRACDCPRDDVGDAVAYTLMELVAVAQTAVLYKVDEINCSNQQSQDYINLRGSINALLKEYGNVTGDDNFNTSDFWKRTVSSGDLSEINRCIQGKPIDQWETAISSSQYTFSTSNTQGFFTGLARTACGLEKLSESNPSMTPPFSVDDATHLMNGNFSYTDANAQAEKLSTVVDSRASATQMQMVALQSLQNHLNAYLTGQSAYQKDYGDILRDILSKL